MFNLMIYLFEYYQFKQIHIIIILISSYTITLHLCNILSYNGPTINTILNRCLYIVAHILTSNRLLIHRSTIVIRISHIVVEIVMYYICHTYIHLDLLDELFMFPCAYCDYNDMYIVSLILTTIRQLIYRITIVI